MTKQYLRVTTNWEKIFDPADVKRFMVNVSGTTIQLKVSPSPAADPASIPMPGFTVGGNIGQITFDADKYVYAKASGDTGIAIWDTTPISLTDSQSVGDQIDRLALEVMKLSERVTTNELKHVEHASAFYRLQRHFLSNSLHDMEIDAQLFNQMFNLTRRLFAAENYIRHHETEYQALSSQVEHLIEDASSNEELSELAVQLAALTQTVNNLVVRVSNLDGITGDNAEQTIATIQHLTEEIATVSADLSNLNNALTVMSAQNTTAEIQAAGAELKTAYPQLSGVVDGLVTTLSALAHKVDYSDGVLIGTDIDGVVADD